MEIGHIFLDDALENLEESHIKKDCLFRDEDKKKLKHKIQSKEKSCLVALVAPYGAGKSTLLNNILPEQNKIEFDAWKVPDRKALWDALVIKCSQNTEKVKRMIDEGKDSSKKKLLSSLAEMIPASIPFVKGISKGTIDFLMNTSPAKRVEEFQNFFFEIVRDEIKFEEKTYIILEDTDRSGSEGLSFLETLSYFIKNDLSKLEAKKVVFIAPIDEKIFYEKFQRYEKVFDYVEFLPKIKEDISEFAKTIFVKGYLEKIEGKQLVALLENLEKRNEVTLRTIKLILRKAHSNFTALKNDGYEPNFNLCTLFESCRYLKNDEEGYEKESLYDSFNRKGFIERDNFQVVSFLHMVMDERESIVESQVRFNIDDRKQTNPWSEGDKALREEKKYFISKFYLTT